LVELRVFYQYCNGHNCGIDVGPDGTIYVTDTWAEGNGRINRYTSSGQPLPPLAPPPADSFYFPRGLTVTQDGVLYVTDTGKHRVVRVNPDGTYAGAVIQGVLQEPVGIAPGMDGMLYVCDVGMKRVAAFTPQGRFVRQLSLLGWKAASDAAVSWIEPYVAVDAKGFVYVSDSTTNTIHRFEPGGRAVAQAGGEGNAPGQLRGPKGIAVDSQGNLYIADSYNHRVVKARFP
jgi:sugar lactone lactonase YvrE